ncbi:MAG: ATP-binding protein, partial [Thermodesulfobacteriota bacterium]|nr:ATP-binding protein [Thermodesulfobacteriota bacterium]
QILTLARLEEGRDVREGAPVAMDRLVGEVAKDARFEAQALDVGVETPRLDSAVVIGEAELLRSAVENVVRNAVRYSPRGGVVSVSVERGGDGPQKRVAVVVEDQGRGIPENQMDHLFRPFYRVEDARDRKTGGTGLGLAIAERAVRLHGGRIYAENRREGGLRVLIDLPGA